MWDFILKNKEWIFSGIGVAVVSGLVARFLKLNPKKSIDFIDESDNNIMNVGGVNLDNGSIVSSYVAGRDLIVNSDSLKGKMAELIDILNIRAKSINAKLSKYYKYVEIESYLYEFNSLHEQHIESLRNNNIIKAHEVLISIHELSSRLESDEFWKRHDIETPHLLYSLRWDAFTRGKLICTYIVGDMNDYSPKYPNDEDFRINEEISLNDIILLYQKIIS